MYIDLQDIKSQSLLYMSINVANQDSRPLYKLPSVEVIRSYINAIKELRINMNTHKQVLMYEYRLYAYNRRLMTLEDYSAKFRDRYDLCMKDIS